jgi:hypothetical protein
MDPRQLQQIGPYKVRRFIDEGAFAWVYEVTDPKFAGRRLALKVLKPEAAAGEEFRRFERESDLLAGIDHPNIVTIFDSGKDPESGCFYYTMTFVDGPTLKKRLARGPLGWQEGARLFIDMLDGLAHLHDQSIVHRDIKPANVLLSADDRGRLSDLGIARVQTERSQTRTGVAVGTALYMSPEQARGRPVDARSDLFSVGLTLYEALTGNVVYDHVDEIDSTSGMDVLIYIGRLDQKKDAEFKIVFPLEPVIPEPVKDVIRKACSLRAEQRYANAREMRDALRGALYASTAPQPAAGGVHWRWIAAPAGVLAAALAGLAYYFFVAVPQAQEARARSEYQTASALDERLRALLEATRDIQPAPPASLLSDVESRARRGGDYLFDAAEDLEAEHWPAAVSNLSRASANFEEACASIVSSFLSPRAQSEEARLRGRAEALGADGAEKVAPEAWKSFDSLLPRLSAPEEPAQGCAAADQELARIAAVSEVESAAAAVEQKLEEVWPHLAEQAQEDAITARKRAEAEPVEAREYKLAVREAKRLQIQGDEKRRGGDYRSARDEYRSAEKQFETALAIVPAARARDETKALAEQLARDEIELGPAVRNLSEGDASFADRQWEQAAAYYKAAGEQLRGLRAEETQRSAAGDARGLALAARQDAVSQGAEAAAPDAFAAAEQARAGAESSLESRQFAAAEEGFRQARDGYAAARDSAIQALREAGQSRSDLRALAAQLPGGGDCAKLGSEEARGACETARSALAEGEAALQSDDAATAQQRFAAAQQAYREAGDALARWEKTRPRPPELVSRTPQRPLVVARKREVRSFSVEARDPNGDPLQYAWSFEGKPLAAAGARLEHQVEDGGVLAVQVSDGHGGELVEQWKLQVENRSPALEVSPTAPRVDLAVGQTQSFAARASDPDGDPVSTSFRLDGREVARGNAYDFRADRPGSYALQVIARDADGGQTTVVRRIQVASARAATPAPLPAVAKPQPGLPDLSGWRGDVVDALRDYERALEQGDLGRLERVFAMGAGSPVRDYYKRKFERGESVDVKLRLRGEIKGDGRNATVDFDQIETSGGRTRTYRYRAAMARQLLTGNWQIERRERR